MEKRTPFENAVMKVANGELKTPKVSFDGKQIEYFAYQVAVHKFNLGIMASGMLVRGIKLKDIKEYYGLKSKSAKECLQEYIDKMNEYGFNLKSK